MFKLYQERDNLPPATKNKLVFDDFIHSQGYRKITNPSGDIMAITRGHNNKSHNIQTLQKAWKEYVHSVTNDADERDSYMSYLDM